MPFEYLIKLSIQNLQNIQVHSIWRMCYNRWLTKIKKHKIITIDAASKAKYYQYLNQLLQDNIKRDIRKAFVGFNLINFETEINSNKTIATGN